MDDDKHNLDIGAPEDEQDEAEDLDKAVGCQI